MAGDWIKLKLNILESIELIEIAGACDISRDVAFVALFKLTAWFRIQGKYGIVKTSVSIIDMVVDHAGFGKSLVDVGWMESHGKFLRLRSFTDVSNTRKALGKKIRHAILESAVCVSCGSPHDLVIDHKIPICKGGGSEPSNLQALCNPCNVAKGRKTMKEFMNDR